MQHERDARRFTVGAPHRKPAKGILFVLVFGNAREVSVDLEVRGPAIEKLFDIRPVIPWKIPLRAAWNLVPASVWP